MLGMNLGIDFGTSKVVIYRSGHGIVLSEPSVIAVETKTGRMLACGDAACKMLGRNPETITVIRPLRHGVIADHQYAEQMLKYFVRKVCSYKIIKPRACASIPASITDVEQRSVWQTVTASGVRHVIMVEEAVAACVGAGLAIDGPHGCMVVDMGGGTTDVAVMTLRGVATSNSVRIGGNDMDVALVRYVRAKFGLIIGEVMAEQAKKQIGRATPEGPSLTMKVRGRDAITGLPRTQEITSEDVYNGIRDVLDDILASVHKVLESTSPELLADIMESGVSLTGGLACMKGMEQRMTERMGLPCRLADEPEYCVAKGAGKILNYEHTLHAGVYNIGQFAYHLSETMEAD